MSDFSSYPCLIWGTSDKLPKKDPSCLEYIAVHEMTHFLERTHISRFVDLMDKHLPMWRTTRDLLNATPLADEAWIMGKK